MAESKLEVFYRTKSRKYSRIFPKRINLSNKLAFVLGLVKGEGANALGKSNYRRFTFTNSDPLLVKLVLDELDVSGLLKKDNLKEKSIYIMHHIKSNAEAREFWSNRLGLSIECFTCFNTQKTTRDYGICHVYVSDVLLRRVVDLLIAQIGKI